MADDPDDDLESTVERLRDRVDDLESQLDQESRSPATATRRDALKAGGAGALLGALGLGSITSGASADPQGRLGSASDPVQQAYINEADVTALSAADLSITNSSDLQQKILSSWGTVYEANDAGMDQAIQDLNSSPRNSFLLTPNGEFTVDTQIIATDSRAIVSQSGTKNGTRINASSNVSTRFIDIQGSHLFRGIRFDGQQNVDHVAEVTTQDVSNVHHELCRMQGAGSGRSLESSNPNGGQDNFNWTLYNSEYSDGIGIYDGYWFNLYDCFIGHDGQYGAFVGFSNGVNIIGGAIGGGAPDALLKVREGNSQVHVQAVAFEGNNGGDSSPPDYAVDWGSSSASGPVDGGGVVNCRFYNPDGGGIGINVRQTSGCYFGFNTFNNLSTAVNAETGNTNFFNATFLPIRILNMDPPAYQGFSTNPDRRDIRLHGGGSFSTS